MFDDSHIFNSPEMQRLVSEVESAGGTPEEIDAQMQGLFLNVSSAMGADLVDRLKKSASAMIANRTTLGNKFRKRLRNKWGTAFDKLRTLLEATTETGLEFNAQYRPLATIEQDFVFDALTRLHARACLLGNEVIWEMEGGFASGAMSRWRTLHELSAVAFFIKEHGQQVAERYLLHDTVDSCKAATQYQKYCVRLGREPLTAEDILRWEEARDELCGRFGKPYGGDWGWAAEALSINKPSFAHIEESIKLDHMRPFFKLACHSNHAGSKGLKFDLGKALVPAESDLLLAGPSDAGFYDPGFCTAVSLLQVTTALLTHKPTVTCMAVVDALNRMVVDVDEAFAEAEAKLQEQAEKEHQKTIKSSFFRKHGVWRWILHLRSPTEV